MKNLRFFFLFSLFFIRSTLFAQEILSPEAFLGYALGTHFTPHFKIMDYVHYVGGISKNMKILEYGKTNEGRPLLVCFISSEKNLSRLEEIRINNIRLTGLDTRAAPILESSTPVICWLSYNVHGNEPSSSEAAMETLYEVLSKAQTDYKSQLETSVLVIDPCINPDGRDRYVNFYNQVSGENPDPAAISREHLEPWPGGRFNHYLFDLNRDWAWQTQKETQARLKLYNAWLPQIHVDFHEMGVNSPYYFSPAGEPYHSVITPWQRKMQEIIGEQNAHVFEKNGWLYFNREDYDLLYPSYGDTYPTYNGSIGMTYEQAGGSRGGLAIKIATGDTLTLGQRVLHHFSTGMTTWLASCQYSAQLLKEFKMYFTSSRENPSGTYKTYVLQFGQGEGEKIKSFVGFLNQNGIATTLAKGTKEVEGFDYFTGKTRLVKVQSGNILINASQPKSRLLQALMEPRTFLSDSVTYDITAWALPYAWGIQTFGLKNSLSLSGNDEVLKDPKSDNLGSEKAYAYLLDWNGMNSLKALSILWKAGVKVRFLNEPMTLDHKMYPEGTLLVTRESNRNLKRDLPEIMKEIQAKAPLNLVSLSTAFYSTSEGFASKKVHFLNRPEIGVLYGPGLDASGFGEIWQFFDQDLDFPAHNIPLENLNARTLKNITVLILPNLNSAEALSPDIMNTLQAWIRQGGKLIAIEGGMHRLVSEKAFNLKTRSVDSLVKGQKSTEVPGTHFGERERNSLRSDVIGSIYKVEMDNTNPLCYGFPKVYFTLKTQAYAYEYLPKDKGWNVGVFKSDAYTSGYSGDLFRKTIANSLAFGWQEFGAGSVVYFTDDPIFRSFWVNGKLLLGNAVFMVGN